MLSGCSCCRLLRWCFSLKTQAHVNSQPTRKENFVTPVLLIYIYEAKTDCHFTYSGLFFSFLFCFDLVFFFLISAIDLRGFAPEK